MLNFKSFIYFHYSKGKTYTFLIKMLLLIQILHLSLALCFSSKQSLLFPLPLIRWEQEDRLVSFSSHQRPNNHPLCARAASVIWFWVDGQQVDQFKSISQPMIFGRSFIKAWGYDSGCWVFRRLTTRRCIVCVEMWSVAPHHSWVLVFTYLPHVITTSFFSAVV